MNPQTKYLYDLPYTERQQLCCILDLDDNWKTLAGHMKYSTLKIQHLDQDRRNIKSPADQLLKDWSYQNHTIKDLFLLLAQMKHYYAMSILKPFVDPKYHELLYEGDKSFTILWDHNENSGLDKEMYGGHNLNVMLPEVEKLNKPGFSKKIQNIGPQVSVEENNSPLLEKNVPFSHAPGTAASPPALVRNAAHSPGPSRLPQLSPVGIAALSAGVPGPSNSSQQRRPSNGDGDYQSVLPRLDYRELVAATDGWNAANILGRGGFGTVFKGVWKETDVAIKRIELQRGDSRESQEIPFQQSVRELQVLQRFHHENILQLYGVSFNGNQPCLVYQFMEKGSLEDRLQCKNRTSPLTWSQRFNIAKGAAKGLQYLHTLEENRPLIHGDIKSANILLDANFEPRIGDFGLAREGPRTNYTSMVVDRVHGTRPYLPIEFLRNKKLSTKVDSFSFGVVLFELATGLRAYDDKRTNKYLKDEVVKHPEELQLMDPKIGKDHVTFSLLVRLGKECVKERKDDRPEMVYVCKELTQHASTASQLTPIELQLLYDGIPKMSIGNVQQPASGQPPNSVSMQPLNGFFLTGHPSPAVSGNTPAPLLDCNVNARFEQVGPVCNVAINSRSTGSNHLVKETSVPLKMINNEVTPRGGGLSDDQHLHPVLNHIPPEISVRPPTESVTSNYSTTTEDLGSRDLQPVSTGVSTEYVNNLLSKDEGPGILPFLTILNIQEDSDVTHSSQEISKSQESKETTS